MPNPSHEPARRAEKLTAVGAVDQISFRRIIRRNIALPLALGVVTMALFVALIAYLVNTMSWVEHSERVIGNANEMLRLAVDRESALRGFLITGDETFLAPYQLGQPRFETEINTLMQLVSDNPSQVEQLKRIRGVQLRWDQFAQEMIDLRRRNLDYTDQVKSGRGKIEFDETRRLFGQFLAVEEALRQQRSSDARSVTFVLVGVFLLFSLSISGFIAYRGRRDLVNLSESYGGVLARQAEHTEVLQQQVWLRSGQRLLAERIVGQSSSPLVGRAILDFLAEYLDVVVAAMYVRDRATSSLKRIATYGFSQESEQATRTFPKPKA